MGGQHLPGAASASTGPFTTPFRALLRMPLRSFALFSAALAAFQGKTAVKILEGDIRDVTFLRRACQGVSVVIHTASIIDTLGLIEKQLLWEVNVTGEWVKHLSQTHVYYVLIICSGEGAPDLYFWARLTGSFCILHSHTCECEAYVQHWPFPHPVCTGLPLQDHSCLSALTYAHPEICTGSAFSGDSHNAMLSGPVWKQFTFEIPVRIWEIGSYSPSPYSIPACVIFNFYKHCRLSLQL